MSKWAAISVDLEPNKDGTLEGVTEAMEWFNETVPRGTVYATYRIATELPGPIADMANDHEIGVHVHPREFGHEHDSLAQLDGERQRELIIETRAAVADAADLKPNNLVAFRAGRHSASDTTISVLADLGFTVDASVNVNYNEHLPHSLLGHQAPFKIRSGLVELPTTYGHPPIISRIGVRAFPSRTVTATANTLRTDKRGTTGLTVLRWLLDLDSPFSFYMHPYDATSYQTGLENNGKIFTGRFESLLDGYGGEFLTASDVFHYQ
ncbi:MAG: polysaccharide deacetylase family protein [Halodesulfurarchaeum sp.]|nr:polysaccharide deacetylase family protein [Halodesulfurarchaeum sp.]